ncbi:phosphoribosyltransferase [Budviciaceae bacterium CWB-B4]|uniref:Phosphoribosyltransferase n=1 Tax=Limnobaculum xujianqingii TaxID=2738837 RepID=A0A9D7AII9_9GAMM|nr:phosphoribosyltransferase [Limnobaculum xujianqingii]MBK5073622.1 phosphoribosyltransferase [Limnobaculum xujianqingii]MBK5176647.1 phosphoribosyltransferase [Limnobaculum xujianqingii]
MGIDVNNRIVTYSDIHEKIVITSVNKNPKISRIGKQNKLFVYSIFTRVRSNEIRGDGNPLIYALKGLKGYSISKREVVKFRPNFDEIITKVINKFNKKHDIILVLPSSSKVPAMFARRVGRALSCDVSYDSFKKNTIYEVLDLFNNNNVKSGHEDEVRGVLYNLNNSNGNLIFSMKDIPNNIRCYFNPFSLKNESLKNKNILLIDDILSTGTSLITANNLIVSQNNQTDALCLLSDLN